MTRGLQGAGRRGCQGRGPHLQQELPALGIVILLRENLAKAGEDSEAVPGRRGAAALSRGLAQLPPPSPDSPPGPHPPHLVASPQAARSLWMGLDCRADTTAYIEEKFRSKRHSCGVTDRDHSYGTSFHTLIPNRVKPLSYLCHADPLLQEPSPLGRTKWPYGHLSKPFSG